MPAYVTGAWPVRAVCGKTYMAPEAADKEHDASLRHRRLAGKAAHGKTYMAPESGRARSMMPAYGTGTWPVKAVRGKAYMDPERRIRSVMPAYGTGALGR